MSHMYSDSADATASACAHEVRPVVIMATVLPMLVVHSGHCANRAARSIYFQRVSLDWQITTAVSIRDKTPAHQWEPFYLHRFVRQLVRQTARAFVSVRRTRATWK